MVRISSFNLYTHTHNPPLLFYRTHIAQYMYCCHCSFFIFRRAQLRDCLEVLRQHVPFPDKLTTLALLQSARKYIEVSSSYSSLM